MAKENINESRPAQQLGTAMQYYPRTPQFVDLIRREKGGKVPDWPNWCFIPMAGWLEVIKDDLGADFALDPHRYAVDIANLAAIGTWRYTQGIYRIDADVARALVATPFLREIPAEVLFRLPEWCLYVDCAGLALEYGGVPVFGFWVHLEYDMNTTTPELRFLVDAGEPEQWQLFPFAVPMGGLTVAEAIGRVISPVVAASEPLSAAVGDSLADIVAPGARFISQIMPLVLFLCSEEPGIVSPKDPALRPSRPQPKRTKDGWRLFPAPGPRVWNVGEDIGTQIRHAADHGSGEGGTKRTHVRRAHWHGYWKGGHGTAQRRFSYKWLPPIVVNPADEEEPS